VAIDVILDQMKCKTALKTNLAVHTKYKRYEKNLNDDISNELKRCYN